MWLVDVADWPDAKHQSRRNIFHRGEKEIEKTYNKLKLCSLGEKRKRKRRSECTGWESSFARLRLFRKVVRALHNQTLEVSSFASTCRYLELFLCPLPL